MQRPNRVTPTKIPSLGVIVRLVSFTGHLRGGLHARCDWRNYSRHDIVKSFSTWLPSLLGRTTPVMKVAIVSGGGDCREADQDAGIGGQPRQVAAAPRFQRLDQLPGNPRRRRRWRPS